MGRDAACSVCLFYMAERMLLGREREREITEKKLKSDR